MTTVKENPKSDRFTVTLPRDLREEIISRARTEDRSVGSLCRAALRRYLAEG